MDVVQYTDKVVELTRVQQELHRPPLCELWWGGYRLIRGVLVSLSQDFTAFLPNGTPVRATLGCTFQEAEPYRELHSADLLKRRVVRAGDTLTQIAHEEYGDLSLWRRIAQANGIDNPLALKPGMSLTIPPLRP
ncbi:LysM peptidoglycan-binding domain-containing protein [Corallococcus sp. 4LFB]|uniref:CIS tube protein n=1 Tax=Corallococcus sp. 4LFB TaxID=3383249 RepID=UPI003974FCD2